MDKQLQYIVALPLQEVLFWQVLFSIGFIHQIIIFFISLGIQVLIIAAFLLPECFSVHVNEGESSWEIFTQSLKQILPF